MEQPPGVRFEVAEDGEAVSRFISLRDLPCNHLVSRPDEHRLNIEGVRHPVGIGHNDRLELNVVELHANMVGHLPIETRIAARSLLGDINRFERSQRLSADATFSCHLTLLATRMCANWNSAFGYDGAGFRSTLKGSCAGSGLAPVKRRASSTRRGLDPWRTAEGIPFTTWDQWLLLLVHGEYGGTWSLLRDRLRDRRRGMGFAQYRRGSQTEPLDDLEQRWQAIRESAREALRRECFPVSPASSERARRAELEARDFYGERESGLSTDVYSRDVIEYAVWKDYGLLGPREMAPFFKRLPKADVVFVDGLLKDLRAELHAAELEYQAEDALTLLGALHVSKKSFDVFVELAREMGSRHWERITTMAESALDAGHHDLAASVFTAADQPGFHRDYVRQQSHRLLGGRRSARPRAQHLTIVR